MIIKTKCNATKIFFLLVLSRSLPISILPSSFLVKIECLDEFSEHRPETAPIDRAKINTKPAILVMRGLNVVQESLKRPVL